MERNMSQSQQPFVLLHKNGALLSSPWRLLPSSRQQAASPKPTGWQHRLEAMEQQAGLASPEQSQSGLNRWLLPYADMLTLMLGLFLVLFTVTTEQNNHLKQELKQAKAQVSQAAQATPLITTADKTLESSLKANISKLSALQTSQSKTPPLAMLQPEKGATSPWQLGKTVQLQQTPQGLMLSLSDQLLFKAGEATLTPSAQQALKALAVTLSKVKRPIRIEGHTDNTPIHSAKAPSNWELSTARATCILRYLVEQGGLAPEQLSASGYGEYRPLVQNSTIEGKQKNRRVAILILNEASAQSEPARPMQVSFHKIKPLASANFTYNSGP